MNRYWRRVQQFGKSWAPRRSPSTEPADKSEDLYRDNTPQDVTDPRTKNQGKGKVTADKWNQ